MQAIFKYIESHTNLPIELQVNFLETLFLFLFASIIKYFVGKGINQWKTDTIKKIQWRRSFNIIINVSIFILVLEIWFGFFGNVSTVFGFASAGIAIALKDPLTNIAGWLYLEFRKPFKVGDRIEIDGQKGDVIDIRYLDFSIVEIENWIDGEQATGRIITIPNNYLFTKVTANYTSDFPVIWNEISFEITYESDLDKALSLVNNTLSKLVKPLNAKEKSLAAAHSHVQISMSQKEAFKTFVAPGKNGTLISMRFIARVYKRRNEVNDIWFNILNEINAEPSVKLAYNTTRIYKRNEESEEALGKASSDL